MIRLFLLLSSLLLLAAPIAQAVMPAEAPGASMNQEEVKLDRDKVRHGNASRFDATGTAKVATVRSSDVYDEIPAYKTIQKEGVEKGSARYNQLIREATKAFKAALKKVAKDGSYVLIVEEGGISGYSHVTDATADIIAAL